MNARELLDDLESGLIDEFMTAEVKAIYIRALRLLAVTEGADGETPETDAFVSVRFGQMVCSHAELRDLARRLERERNGLAARVAELEAFQLERQSSEYLDAERYRYLRDRADENSDGPIICSGLGDNFDFLRGAECDEEIDAARGSKP